MSEKSKKFELKIIEDRLVIYMGSNEDDVLYSYGYDGTPNQYEAGELETAPTIGTVELSEEQLTKIKAEYENGGECGWCGEVARKLRHSHMFDRGTNGEKMCKHCWNHDRGVYLGSYGEDIGPYDAEDESKQCCLCHKFLPADKLLGIDDGKYECEDCAQAMSDLAP